MRWQDGSEIVCDGHDYECIGWLPEEKKVEKRVSITIKREDLPKCYTYFDTAEEIAKIEFPVGSKEWKDAAARRIKLHGHHMKLDIYERCFRWLHGYGQDREPDLETMKFALETIQVKIQTHEDYSTRSYEEVM